MKIVGENKVPLKSVPYGRVLSFANGDKIQYCIKAHGGIEVLGGITADEGKYLLVNLQNGSLWKLSEDEMVSEYPHAKLNLGAAGYVGED